MSKILLAKHVRDHMTFDAARPVDRVIDSLGSHQGHLLGHRFTTHDGRMVDSTGAFLVGELERLDYTLNQPLVSVTWGRDIDLRTDVTTADDNSSFTLSTFGAPGSLGAGNTIGTGKSWMGKSSNQISGIDIDISKRPFPLTPWSRELKFSILELESAAKLGRPIDQQKYEGMALKHQMDIDEMVYVGDADLGLTGLVNNSLVTSVSNVPVGASTFTRWNTKTPAEILADINNMLTTTWAASAWAVMPSKILIPPAAYGYLTSQVVSSAGNTSILKYVLENNILTTSGGGKLDIQPLKWLIGAGIGGTLGTTGTVDRAVVYTKSKQYVRYPMTTLNKTPVQFDSMYHKTTYYCKLGAVEAVYPETMSYWDGI